MEDTEKLLSEAIVKARRVADQQPEIYRSTAFEAALNLFLGLSTARSPEAAQVGAPASIPRLTMQLNEFLASRKLESHPDRIIAIAYYKYRTDGESITTKDVLDAYARTRIKKPQNVHDVISTCIRRGFLVDTDKKDGLRAWHITPSGEAYVDTDLSQPARGS